MNTLLQLGWGVWMGLWWISGLIIFFFVVFLVFMAGPGITKAKEYHKKLKQRYENHVIDKSEYERLTQCIAEEDSLYQN